MKASGLTDVGSVRTNNEDAMYVGDNLLIVADGMGGAAAGEIASSLAIETLTSELSDISTITTDEGRIERLREAILKADRGIKAEVERESSYFGMGTTVVCALNFDSRILIGYVGDSRAYIITNRKAATYVPASDATPGDAMAATAILTPIDIDRKDETPGSITRITRDHSVVMEMVASGVITEDDIRTHPLRNRITRCVGSEGSTEPDFVWHTVSPGDRLLICSDGLWEMIHDDVIMALVNSSFDPDEICGKLIEAAKKGGGVDNITAIVALFEQD